MALTVLNLLGEGEIAYSDGLRRQRELVALRREDRVDDTLILLQHRPTVTFGKTTRPENLLLTPAEYAQRGIELVETDRGGDVTYHGPGQLVVYPIIHLGEGSRDVHRYVRSLEEVVIRAARRCGVTHAARAPWHAGVWVGDGYLAALGVRVSRWVTHHGFALNVTDEVMDGFATIVPCGVAGKAVVSLSRAAAHPVTVADAARTVAAEFATVFGAQE